MTVFRILAIAMALLVYLFLGLKAALQFDPIWDVMSYHLGAALQFIGATTYEPGPRLGAVISGYPPLPHMIQGILMLVTTRLTSIQLLNFVGLLALFAGIKRCYGRAFDYGYLAMALLTVPVVIFQLANAYIDIFASALVALVILAIASLCRSFRDDDVPVDPRPSFWIAGAALVAAALTKMTLWPFVGLFAVIWTGAALLLVIRKRLSPLVAGLGVAVVALGVVAWPLVNVARFKNPTYPFQTPVTKYFVEPEDIPEVLRLYAANESFDSQIAVHLKGRSQAYLFLYSVFEASRFEFPETPLRWSIDAGTDNGPFDPGYRVGGWSVWTVVVTIVMLTALTVSRAIPSVGPLLVLMSCGLLLVVPQSHELRYWAFVPMAALGLVAGALPRLRASYRNVIFGITFALMVYTGFVVRRDVGPLRIMDPVDSAPAEAVAYWQDPKRPDYSKRCLNQMPLSIYWAGPTFNTYRVKDCF